VDGLLDSVIGFLFDVADLSMILASDRLGRREEHAEFLHQLEGAQLTEPHMLAMVFEYYDPLELEALPGGSDLYRQFSERAARETSIEQWIHPRVAATNLERIAHSLPGGIGDAASRAKLLASARSVARSIAASA
jgi:hypothetical protein